MNGLVQRCENIEHKQLDQEVARPEGPKLDLVTPSDRVDEWREGTPKVELNEVKAKRVGAGKFGILDNRYAVRNEGEGQANNSPAGEEKRRETPPRDGAASRYHRSLIAR